MRSLLISFLAASFGILSSFGTRAETQESRVATMPFADCLAIIAEASQEVDAEPVRLASTDDLITVRIDASDGHVTVSCSRPDNKMTLTKNPRSSTAGMTVSR